MKPVSIRLPETMLEAIEKYQKDHNIKSQHEAIRILINQSLSSGTNSENSIDKSIEMIGSLALENITHIKNMYRIISKSENISAEVLEEYFKQARLSSKKKIKTIMDEK